MLIYQIIKRKLLILYLFFVYLIFRVIHRNTKPIIHYYAVCWNEEDIIPFVFKYYDTFVDYYYIYDNGSTDNTIKLLQNRKNVTIIPFDTNSEFNVIENQRIKNDCWKQSRGKADWVIVCDMDEFLYHPEGIINLLIKNKSRYSIYKPKGFEMCSEHYPQKEMSILEQVHYGYESSWYNKQILFNPYKITEIDYEPGFHSANPKGIVKYCNDSDLKLLHYKKLSAKYLIKRYTALKQRYNKENINKGMGNHYQHDIQKIIDDYRKELQKSQKVL